MSRRDKRVKLDQINIDPSKNPRAQGRSQALTDQIRDVLRTDDVFVLTINGRVINVFRRIEDAQIAARDSAIEEVVQTYFAHENDFTLTVSITRFQVS